MTRRSHTQQYPDVAARPAAPLARRDRPARGELHGLHAVRPRVPGLVHLHRLAQGGGASCPARPGPGSATCSTASPSTSRCACTAASASRPARSTRCYWTPEFEYAEYDIRDLLHDKDRLGEWMATVPPPPAHDPQRRAVQGGGRRARKAAAARRQPRPTPTGRPDRRPSRWPRRRRRDRRGLLLAALGAVAVGSGALVVTTRHLVRAGLWLVVSLGARRRPATWCSAPSWWPGCRC